MCGEATNREKAIRLAQELEPDVVILDISNSTY
jgi:chemotaxis response regulator CheB